MESALVSDCAGEVIVVDDGSDDGTAELLEAYRGRIRIERQRPSGGNVARNRLLALATLPWVQYLDADDYLEPHKIRRQLDEAGTTADADVLYSPVWLETWQDGQAVHRDATVIDSSADLFTQWINWQLPQTGGALWRRESLRRIGGWKEDQPCCQEHELYLRALQAGLKFQFCPTPGAVYRIWSEATVCRRDPAQVVHERTKLIDQALAWLSQQRTLSPQHSAAAGQVCFEMARTLAKIDLALATRYYRERRQRGLIRPTGPAAPPAYRLVWRLLGFAAAERIARMLRRHP